MKTNLRKGIYSIFIFLTMFMALNASEIKHISSEAEFNKIVNEGGVVVADFFATWCPPCKMLAPILKELAKDFGDKITVIKIDVDKNRELAIKYGISPIPDVRILKDKKEVEKIIGLHPKKYYYDLVAKYLKK